MKHQILACAIRLIETGSPLEFSVAKVAKAAGISQGNLTYHFPKKSDLIHAVVQHLIERYQTMIDFSLDAQADDGIFARFTKFMLENATNPAVINSFIFLWVNALKDAATAKQLANFYEQSISHHEQPNKHHKHAKSYAHLTLTGILNGMIPIMGVAKAQFDYEGYLQFLQNLMQTLQLSLQITNSSD